MSSLQVLVSNFCKALCWGAVLLTGACSNGFDDVSEPLVESAASVHDLGSILGLDSIGPGRSLTQDMVDGKVVYIDFWASWCAPCIQSLPFLNELRNQYAGEGFELVSVNVDVDPKKALAFIEALSLEFPVLRDPDSAVMQEYKITGLPTGILIDAESEVILTHLGFSPADEAFLRARIDREVRRRRFSLGNIN